MKVVVAALCSGVVFGAGLALSGMTNPAKVQNFLDIAGSWDPSLALVMGSALAVSSLGYQFGKRREAPAFAERFSLPTRSDIDPPLLAGSAIFGVGWGLAGICPGPALAMSSVAADVALPFVIAMLAGIGLHRLVMAR